MKSKGKRRKALRKEGMDMGMKGRHKTGEMKRREENKNKGTEENNYNL